MKFEKRRNEDGELLYFLYDKVNFKNKYITPELMEKSISVYNEEKIKNSQSIGECIDSKYLKYYYDADLPYEIRMGEILIKNVSHIVRKIKYLKETFFEIEVELLDTYNGKILKTFFDDMNTEEIRELKFIPRFVGDCSEFLSLICIDLCFDEIHTHESNEILMSGFTEGMFYE